MEIVEFNEKHIKGYNVLMNEISEEEIISVNKKKTLEEREKWFKVYKRLNVAGKYIILIGIEKGKVVGASIANCYEGKRSHVWEIGYNVRRNCRRSGKGSELVTALLDYLKSTNAEELTAWVVEENKPSVNLLKKFGFKEVGRISKGVKLKGGKYCDYFLFQRGLDQ